MSGWRRDLMFAAIAVGTVYTCTAFARWEIDPAAWRDADRAIAIFVASTGLLFRTMFKSEA